MAFLDNSGDIILDAVLTDTGRFRLAKGDGSFKIVKFALGDDEINYGLYNKNHASGSAYYDLSILQTPVLEAFTNNTSTMKSKLVSIPRSNLLYLPVLKLAGDATNTTKPDPVAGGTGFDGPFYIAVDQQTAGQYSSEDGLLELQSDTTDGAANANTQGILDGFDPFPSSNSIRVDQGLDTLEVSSGFTLDADLRETQYIIEIDNRFGTLVSAGSDRISANVSFIDDDNIASYYLSLNTDPTFVQILDQSTGGTTIQGPRGTWLNFKIQASTELQTSYYLFDQLGTSGLEVTGISSPTAMTCKFIDSTVRITGATTGYQINIPIRFVKKTN